MPTDDTRTEINTTVRWGIGIILAIFAQTGAGIWYFSQLDATVEQHSTDIKNLQSGTSVYISRDQLDDLLGARDEKTANIEKSLLRIEGKLDRILP